MKAMMLTGIRQMEMKNVREPFIKNLKDVKNIVTYRFPFDRLK
jgi:hypothetical protein